MRVHANAGVGLPPTRMKRQRQAILKNNLCTVNIAGKREAPVGSATGADTRLSKVFKTDTVKHVVKQTKVIIQRIEKLAILV
jgi:hypothetical protein